MSRPIASILVLLLLLTGCDDTFVDPFENEARYYTVYGYLDVVETKHELRVVPVTRTPEHIDAPTHPQANLDATVRTINLTTEEVVTWTHSLEALGDGTFGHIFSAQFIVRAGHTYRLEVERSDGKMTTAETTVPMFDNSYTFEPAPMQVAPDTSSITREVFIPGIPSPWEIQSVYFMENETTYGPDASEGTLHGRFFIPYARMGTRTEDGGWRITVDMLGDHETIRAQLADYRLQGVYDDSPVAVTGFGLQVRVLDGNWDPPEGVFDPEVLAQPDVLSNVTNGYGFFGSIGLFRQEWNVPQEEAQLLGYWWYPPI